MTTQRLYVQARQIWEDWRPIMRRAAARTGCTPAYIKEKSHVILADKSFKLVTAVYDETVRSMDAEDRETLSKEAHQDVLHFMHRQFMDWSKEAEKEQQQA